MGYLPPVIVNILVETYREFVPENSVLRNIRSIQNGANRHSDENTQSNKLEKTDSLVLTAKYIACTFAMSTGWTYVVTRTSMFCTSSS
jgi:hypothetical protein